MSSFNLIFIITIYFQVSTGAIFKNQSNFPTVFSITKFDGLVRAEIRFVEQLKNILHDLEPPVKAIAQRYLKNFNDAHKALRNYNDSSNMDEKVEAVAGNLIATYLKVRRFLEDFYPLAEHLLRIQPKIVADFEDWGYSEGDLKLTENRIVVTVHAYNLTISHFVDGRFLDTETGVKLNALQCYDIGVRAFQLTMYVVALPFFEVAAEKAKVDGSISEAVIEASILSLIKEHDWSVEYHLKSDMQFQNLFNKKLGPLRKRYGEEYKSMRIPNRRLKTEGKISYPANPYIEHPLYYDLCVFKNLQSEEEKSSLFCWYETGLDPYWYINPLKMELLSSFIEAVQMYDMLGEKTMKHMKDLLYKRQGTISSAMGAPVDAVKVRESTDPMLRTLPLSFEKMSGLFANQNSTTEPLRISAYAPGLNFMSHIDEEPKKRLDDHPAEDDIGASGIYILEVPELGGETVFVHARFTVRPVPGSLLYWIGLKSQGTPDRDTVHGGCPPLLGRKWLVGKWMYYLSQFQNQRCGLKPDEKVKLFPKSETLKTKYYNKKRFMYFT